MGYIKVALRAILNQLDYNNTFPYTWNNFVKKQTVHHNLIIKSAKNICFCTYCHSFFTSKKKILEKLKCPNCHNVYLIKRSNLKYYEFKDYLAILDIVDNTFVIRYFELKTTLDSKHTLLSSLVEFAREIINNNSWERQIFVNDHLSRCQCHIYINHSDIYSSTHWRPYTRNYSLIDYSIVFPDNLKALLQNTDFKYSGIWDIAKHCNYIDLSSLLKNKFDLSKVEILSKMKLYNLALDSSDLHFNGSFYKTFGVSKNFYPFMKRHNITYQQLKILRLLQEPNITKIKYLEQITHFNRFSSILSEISEYINLNKLIKYSKMHHSQIGLNMYKDYLRFAKFLGFDLKNNKYVFPKNLKKSHDSLEKQYKIKNKELISTAIKNRYSELLKNKFSNNKFIIFPANSLEALQNESAQQNNCVRTYAEKYANGKCDIYFMRNISNPDKSLVTVEVINNKVVQSRIKNNLSPNKCQLDFLDNWEHNTLASA